MNRPLLIKSVLLMTGSALLGTGCVYRTEVRYRNPPPPGYQTSPEVEVNGAPPPDMVETVTVAPGPDFVWIGGAWFWGGGRWVWHGGYWGHQPHPGAVWVGPHYYYRGGRHVWVRGGWR